MEEKLKERKFISAKLKIDAQVVEKDVSEANILQMQLSAELKKLQEIQVKPVVKPENTTINKAIIGGGGKGWP